MPFYVRIVANPVVSAFADRHGRLADVLAGCAVTVVVATTLLLLADGFWGILLVVVAIAMAQGPLIALADALTLTRLAAAAGQISRYGGIRLWGSIAFALANVSAGTLLLWLPPRAIIVFLIIASAVVAAAALVIALRSRPSGRQQRAPRPARLDPARMRLILLVVAGAACVQASHGLLYAFSTLHWQAIGLSSATVGGLWAVGVVAEICFFALLGRLLAAGIGPAAIVLLGAAAAVARWVAMAADPGNVAVLVLLQTGHAVSFGATHAGSVFLLAAIAPEGHRAQAQGWLAAAWAGLMAILISLSGYLLPTWSERTYLMMAGVAALGLLLLAASAVPRPLASPVRTEV